MQERVVHRLRDRQGQSDKVWTSCLDLQTISTLDVSSNVLCAAGSKFAGWRRRYKRLQRLASRWYDPIERMKWLKQREDVLAQLASSGFGKCDCARSDRISQSKDRGRFCLHRWVVHQRWPGMINDLDQYSI